MKPSTVSLSLAAAASAALLGALTTGAPCDLSAIQSALLPNATAGLEQCATTSGVDIWALSDFPTEEQAQAVMHNRDCVDFLNQVNQRANAQIQCDLTVGNQTVVFADLIVDFLSGQTGEPEASASGSDDIEFPDSDSGSSDVGSSEASDSGSSEAASDEASEGSEASVGDDSASKSSASSGGSAVAAASLAVAAAAVLAGSLGL